MSLQGYLNLMWRKGKENLSSLLPTPPPPTHPKNPAPINRIKRMLVRESHQETICKFPIWIEGIGQDEY